MSYYIVIELPEQDHFTTFRLDNYFILTTVYRKHQEDNINDHLGQKRYQEKKAWTFEFLLFSFFFPFLHHCRFNFPSQFRQPLETTIIISDTFCCYIRVLQVLFDLCSNFEKETRI